MLRPNDFREGKNPMTKQQRNMLCQKMNITNTTLYNWQTGKTKDLSKAKQLAALLYAAKEIDFIPDFLQEK